MIKAKFVSTWRIEKSDTLLNVLRKSNYASEDAIISMLQDVYSLPKKRSHTTSTTPLDDAYTILIKDFKNIQR